MADANAFPAADQPLKVPDDVALVHQIHAGSEQAFRDLVNRHARYLYGVAHSVAGAADAEDVVQETLAAILTAKFAGKSSVRTWLVGILVRQAAMVRRKKRPITLAQESLDRTATASGQAGSDAKMDLASMLEQLSVEHRQVLVLRELEGMSYEEIAAVLEIPKGTVESRLHRARETMRQRFKGYM
jgi:RNA polymerase sigma-70 factor (ECF subfamily)